MTQVHVTEAEICGTSPSLTMNDTPQKFATHPFVGALKIVGEQRELSKRADLIPCVGTITRHGAIERNNHRLVKPGIEGVTQGGTVLHPWASGDPIPNMPDTTVVRSGNIIGQLIVPNRHTIPI